MPFVSNTPELLLSRSDSKNPNTTCRGITSNGRPCRRALAVPNSPARESKDYPGSVSNHEVAPSGSKEYALEGFYCWQHKDQATQGLSSQINMKLTNSMPPRERSSIDTLCDRLQVIDVESNAKPASKQTTRNTFHTPKSKPQRYPQSSHRRAGFFGMLCCSGMSDQGDYMEIVRHRQRAGGHPRPDTTVFPQPQPVHARKPQALNAPFPQTKASPASPTAKILSVIPQSLSAKTTSTLLTELSKPISEFDEDGYIYIFWLTDEQRSAPGSTFASELLVPSSPDRPPNDRRQSEVLAQYASADDNPAGDQMRTILLKVGRANNVHRRMNEWSRQCGYKLSLVRFYPHMPSTSSPAQERHSTPNVRKVPFSHRVERLIHIELAEKQVKQPRCDSCGRQHREWFGIEASRAGLRQVDEIVKRWIAWAESTRSGAS